MDSHDEPKLVMSVNGALDGKIAQAPRTLRKTKKRPLNGSGRGAPSPAGSALRDSEWTDDLIRRYAYSTREVEPLPALGRDNAAPPRGQERIFLGETLTVSDWCAGRAGPCIPDQARADKKAQAAAAAAAYDKERLRAGRNRRGSKAAAIDPDPPDVALRRKRIDLGDLCWALTELLREWVDSSVDGTGGKLVAGYHAYLPLHYFDDATFDTRRNEEWVVVERGELEASVDAAGLYMPREDDEYGTGAPAWGMWRRCMITSYDPSTETYEAVWYGGSDAVAKLHRVEVCFHSENRRKFIERFKAALMLRRSAEALLRYHLYVESMPYNSAIVGALEKYQGTRILAMATPSGLEKGLTDRQEAAMYETSTRLLQEATQEYRDVMNRLVFDANMMNPSNLKFYHELSLPDPPAPPPVPYLGVVPTPPHGFRATMAAFKEKSFMTEAEGIEAALAVREDCLRMAQTVALSVSHRQALVCDVFRSVQKDALDEAVQAIKEDWPQKTGTNIRRVITAKERSQFNTMENNMARYKSPSSAIGRLLSRCNFVMTDILREVVTASLRKFADYIVKESQFHVLVESTNRVTVHSLDSEASEAAAEAHVPVFLAYLNATTEKVIINHDALRKQDEAIKAWRQSPAGQKEDAECPLQPVEPMFGYCLQYDTPPPNYCTTVLDAFDGCIERLQGVHHIQRYVMERLFWSNPETLKSLTGQEEWVKALRRSITDHVKKATEPLYTYLETYGKWMAFLNLDLDEYFSTLTHRKLQDPEEKGAENTEAPVKVDVAALTVLLDDTKSKQKLVLEDIPAEPINGGMFLIDASAVRNLLSDKYQSIMTRLLEDQRESCLMLARFIDTRFTDLEHRLNRVPRSIEEVVELEDFIRTVGTSVNPLQETIAEMMAYHTILDHYRFQVTDQYIRTIYNAFGWPTRFLKQIDDVKRVLQEQRERFLDEMQTEQKAFQLFLEEVQNDLVRLEVFDNIADVKDAAKLVTELDGKLTIVEEKARLFNSREDLFGSDPTDYDGVAGLRKAFEPYSNLWATADNWLDKYQKWTYGKFDQLDAEAVEKDVDTYASTISKAVKYFEREEKERQAGIAAEIKQQVFEFKPQLPLIVSLRNPGMRERHWSDISKSVGIELVPDETFTLARVIEMRLGDHLEAIQKVAESAAKEYQIEQALDKMEHEWKDIFLQISPYRETGTGIVKGIDEVNAVLDEHVTMTQAMQFSAFKGPFEGRIEEWNRKLYMVSEVLEAMLGVQRNWLYLQPIFESPDINKQLPTEGKKFSIVDKTWRHTISSAKSNAKVIELCDNDKLLERFKEGIVLLDQVQKGLSDYLETKRGIFGRLYFLSNEELLDILSEAKDIRRVQPHLKKVFEGVDQVEFGEDMLMVALISPEGERVPLKNPLNPKGKNVEAWLLELENEMKVSVRDVIHQAIVDYSSQPRTVWMQKWPGQCVLNGSQVHWTKETEELLKEKGRNAPRLMLERQLAQLADMVVLVRGELGKNARTAVGALTVIDVHARDVMRKLVNEEVSNKADFTWTSQLRYYWADDLFAEMVAARRPYGYEYLGNTFRLVITPLTDKCYLTLMGALQMMLGGAPAGPAGTGKTETTKDLAKALAMQCVVFNCSDGLDYIAMGKFFKGLAACGAWACFDEFNRINIEVLSVIGQQIMTIQLALKANVARIDFEGSNIPVKNGFYVCITMNPGYAGRSELPDSLKALFRPVAMMVPDYALIGEIMFFAYGFENAGECGLKMVTLLRLCSEQLSAQPHYDYGMRAVKTVITAAGNLKRAEPESDEMVLLLRALQDVNYPKFLAMDLPLFEGIMSDLFPGRSRPTLDYGALFAVMKYCIERRGLQPHLFFISKVIQLYEMIVVRHGLMLVGPTGGGKSANLHVLEDTLTELKRRNIKGFGYEKVVIYQLNPKSITMGQMYGQFDESTHEWQDGIMSTMYREAASSQSSDRKWVMFDGPVDAIWIENMNTVLDDNKKLCLNSGEIIKMSPEMTMMFEVEDLIVASPATVSRVGIIYMEPKALGINVLVQSWLQRLPEALPRECLTILQTLFDTYLAGAMGYMRQHMKELVPTMDNNIAESCMRILDCYLDPFHLREGRDPPSEVDKKKMIKHIEAIFLFALVWSVGATADEKGRAVFDAYLRSETTSFSSPWRFPKEGKVYDYTFDQRGGWMGWMDTTDPYVIDPKLSFSEIVVPTMDSVRNTYLLHLLLMKQKHVLMVGNTGTGKSINISQYLMGASRVNKTEMIETNCMPFTITFSAQTSANMTQDMIDGKVEKRRKGVFGPAAGKCYIIHVDDMNMPKRETYGAQPPVELLRQWFDQGGWYDRKELTFRQIVDLVLICSMGPPGGGRQIVTPRFIRHFNVIGYVEMSDTSKSMIFRVILSNFLSGFDGSTQRLCQPIVNATIDVFNTIIDQLLPTPSKSHYLFNLRDLAKVFQGMLMGDSRRITKPEDLVRLWIHENKRVFEDRLTNREDHEWFTNLMKEQVEKHFSMEMNDLIKTERLIYGDYLHPGADPRIYEEVTDLSQLKPVIEEYLSDFNSESNTPMDLVMFTDAIEHVSRITRVLRQPQGNALLLGVGGSGRQSMTKLATYIAGYNLFQVEIKKGYRVADWRDDIKRCLLGAGLKDKPTTFLFNDAQIVNEIMLEDINNILNAGDVPNLYGPEELDQIMTVCRSDCQKKRIPPTKLNIFAQYIIRVRRNIHVVLCMSPLGEAFRDRLRMFPSLVNCCTIDWFTEWPSNALRSVALAALKQQDLELDDHMESVVTMMMAIHQSVELKSIEFHETLRRRVYVTPTSYLELLQSFRRLLQFKRDEVDTMRRRLQIGLDKLSSTKAQVSIMQEELKVLQPQLVKTQAEVDEMMAQITVDKAAAAETRIKVEEDEKAANDKAVATQAIADDAQRDLDEAMPALEAALECLKNLKKSDVDEVKSLKTPPYGVKLTMQVCCLMFNVAPVMKNDPEKPGKKVADFWEAAQKNLLGDAKAFMESLMNFDKDNIPDKVIRAVEPFMKDPAFTPKEIEKASKACTAICMWAQAMYKYHFVALAVAPKRAKLAEASGELSIVMAQLNDAKGRLAAVVARLADLESAFNAAVAKKDALQLKAEQCKIQLVNAEKLIGGLGGEEARWRETVDRLMVTYTSVTGDVLVSAGTISYLGPFTYDFRTSIVEGWQKLLEELRIPHTPGCDMESTLAQPVKLREWQLAGLPTDTLSTQNGIVMDCARRWPLLIDPQGQANRFIRGLGKDKTLCLNGMDVLKLSDKNFLRSLENGIRFGKWALLENIGEELDAALEPILLQQKFKQGGQTMIRLGDNTVPYNDSFRFFMTTKLPNPHYPPEVQVKVSLLNFTITQQGLEEQLLGVVVKEEMPELAEKKVELVVQNAEMNKQLYDIETQILYLLSNSTGNILDDTVLIETLAQAKATSETIKGKMSEAAETEKAIVEKSEEYRPVANRASLLYFCIADLFNVDPMYMYALPWFTQLFVRGINSAPPAAELQQRLENLNAYFTYSLYTNICRSLFEKHKLLFSFLLCIKIPQGDGEIDLLEWRYLISGMSPGRSDLPNPNPTWIEPNVWADILALSGLPPFRDFPRLFVADLSKWKELFDSNEPQNVPLPAPYDAVTGIQRMCILRCIRRDKIMEAIQDYVISKMGRKYVEPPPFDLKASYNESVSTTPLIFVLSTGSDPNKDLLLLADQLGMADKLKSIALGQGQGKLASRLIENGIQKGEWVLLQNCHLSISWMPDLEKIVEEFEPDKIHKDFRLWLTSMPTKSFPASVLQAGVKMTKEPPKGLRANLKSTYIKMNDEKLNRTCKPEQFRKLLFGLCFYHALVIERKKFGPLGWNVPYEFNDTDLDISNAQLELYVNEYDEIPYQVLQQLTSVVNYGGRITDDKDMRTSDIIIADFFTPKILTDKYKLSRSGTYYSIDPDRDAPHKSYMDYIEQLPLNPEPEVFGMHDNANITCAISEVDETFAIIVSLQPRVGGGGGISREDLIGEIAKSMEKRLPALWDIEAVMIRYPTDYYESNNTVLVQEAQRYNALVALMKKTLSELQKALKGLVVLSFELEAMGNSIFDQLVPAIWEKKAYPSLKPLGPWFEDLLQRLAFVDKWIENGTPSAFWISGFFFPQGFLTANLQNHARKHHMPIDTVSYGYNMLDIEHHQITEKPEDGCYIYGLFLEGARWDKAAKSLVDPKPKELFSPMPVMHLLPEQHRKQPTAGIYRSPVYKVLTRTGTLSTTGHSTNFVMWIEIPSDKPTVWRSSLVSETNAQVKFCDQDYWIKAGVACFCALKY